MRKHGPYALRSLKGQPIIEGEYRNGSKTGVWRVWHRTGALAEETEYLGGRRQGVHRSWYDSGSPKVEER